MMIYYKATKTDGTDFYTGTVDYAGALESGRPLPLLTSTDDKYRCCTSDVYHAADVPVSTLIGCSWPCRLFEVEGEPVDQDGHKFGFRTMSVLREVPAWQALGPNGEAVAALIERAGNLTPREVRDLGAARYAAGYAAWGAAWGAAGYAVGYAARDAAGYAAWGAARGAARGAAQDAAGYAAQDAARDAALALLAGDLISGEQSNILYGPWASVIDNKEI